ncbi:3-deoxy-7-phosphoheptulonate synthase [Spirochaeta thermophila]|uniref:Uncharacterized protein n=1 Tax=Winmispira thermophila (strain ATCC 49972 / DSM 6192 / RI 19.B1) TaxID=665571 RepID=E0RPX3_WINT6|nr:3-deoxy-7-phosphoheptulonate synthase [Spirochaeta thermophila]ADN02826.1 hypothetical protein STHERM_c18910 [Spirochaeta thermophila DSM 6192]
MVIVLERGVSPEKKARIRAFLESRNLKVREIVGEEETILGAVGQVTVDLREVELLPGVARVIPITKPYKLASREFKKTDTVVTLRNGVRIGGNRITVIAGPCAVEGRDQILEAAHRVKESGAVILRGGAFKPRTSPYSFQGLGEKGLEYLKEASEETGLPVVSEVVATEHVDLLCRYVDVLQIGARNMQNFELLKRVGATGKPVLLKRGLAATIEEWLMAAEYLLAHGAEDVILCERGIRTFETYTRNTLDLSAIPVVKKLSHLPVIVDPSHATGIRTKVPPMALAAVAAGADGLMVEVHVDPDRALSDGAQSLYPEQFEKLMRDLEALAPVLGKEVERVPERRPIPVAAAPHPDREGGSLLVAFQGEHGAFSEKALALYFADRKVSGVPTPSFSAVFDAVLEGKVDYGIIPIENSLSGSILENYDLLLQYPDVKIVGETQIRVEHSLIGLPSARLEDIKKVYSHPQGFAQCARFLDQFPSWERVPFYDTAGAVAFIAREGDPSLAAIANEVAAGYYGMKVLKQGIETNPRNYTRFFIIARLEHPEVPRPTKASISFQTPDQPGALFRCLGVIADARLNLKKLESRPILGKPWNYMFFLDMELPEDLSVFHRTMEALDGVAENLKVLGLYRSRI